MANWKDESLISSSTPALVSLVTRVPNQSGEPGEQEEPGEPNGQGQQGRYYQGGASDSICVPGCERFGFESSRSPSLRPRLAGVSSLGVGLAVVVPAESAVSVLAEEQ